MNAPTPPPSFALLQLLTGRWVSTAISAVARLGVADELVPGPRTSEELAKKLGANADALHRILRSLASVGVFAQDDEERFVNTPLSEMLRTSPESLRAMAIMISEPPLTRAWDNLMHAVTTGESAFQSIHNANLFDYIGKDPELGRVFDNAMTSRSAMESDAITAAFDFAEVPVLADIGGGHGKLLSAILAKNPSQKGILFDLPSVVAGAGPLLERAGVAGRCEVVGGSFFEHVPKGADGYLLKHILHDWDDPSCVRILKTIHSAAKSGARLFVADAVVAPGNAQHFAKILDLQMMVLTPGGRERTRPEWERLLMGGGFTLQRVIETRAPIAIIEAVRS